MYPSCVRSQRIVKFMIFYALQFFFNIYDAMQFYEIKDLILFNYFFLTSTNRTQNKTLLLFFF